MSEPVYGFPPAQAARVASAVKRVEKTYVNPKPSRRRYPVVTGGGNLVRIWMPTGISGGTFGSPASKADVIIAVRSVNGWTTSGGTTITLYNCDTTAVTGAKAGWARDRGDGTYELVIGDC